MGERKHSGRMGKGGWRRREGKSVRERERKKERERGREEGGESTRSIHFVVNVRDEHELAVGF